MIFIDANVFLAYFNEDDVHHTRAVHLFDQIRVDSDGPAFTSDYIFNEVVGVSLRKFGKDKAVLSGDWILRNVPIMNADDFALSSAWKAFSDSDLSLSLVDWSNIAVMQLAETDQIATFDKAFDSLPDVHVIR